MSMGASSSVGNLYGSEHNLSKSGGGGGGVHYMGSGVPSNHHARDSSLMGGINHGMGGEYGASSMQQISYYDYLSRDDEEGEMSRDGVAE